MKIDNQNIKSLDDIKINFNNVNSWLTVLWWLAYDYRDNNPTNENLERQWDDICTVIHWIDDNLKRSSNDLRSHDDIGYYE